MELFLSSDTWVLIAFLVFCALVYKFGMPLIVSGLDNKIEAIRTEVTAAETMRVEAQELLAQYQRKLKEAEQEADALISKAKDQAKALQAEAKKELAAETKRREEQLEQRIALMEKNAVAHIREHAAKLTLQASREIIDHSMNEKENARISNDLIGALSFQRQQA